MFAWGKQTNKSKKKKLSKYQSIKASASHIFPFVFFKIPKFDEIKKLYGNNVIMKLHIFFH